MVGGEYLEYLLRLAVSCFSSGVPLQAPIYTPPDLWCKFVVLGKLGQKFQKASVEVLRRGLTVFATFFERALKDVCKERALREDGASYGCQ